MTQNFSTEDAMALNPDNLVLEELERHKEIERAIQVAAEVIFDLQSHGALYRYIMLCRDRAKQALWDLVGISPHDAAGIAEKQAAVRAYVDACAFVDMALKTGEQAEAAINEEYHDA